LWAVDDVPRRLQAVASGHGNVHHHHVGAQLPGQTNGLLTGTGLPYDDHVWLVIYDLSGCLTQHSVIIRQQDADLASHGIPLPPLSGKISIPQHSGCVYQDW